jgi:Ca2+-binding RTX toxin-like protein
MGNDSSAGGAGDDWISQAFGFGEPEPGNDTIDGGTGVDLIEYDWLVSDLVIDLAAGTITGGGWDGAGHATVTNVESILIHGTGTTNDRIVGNSVANNLAAGAGSDTLAGGAGNDTLSGGAGGDTFILDVAPGSANFDVITEFTSGADRIRLDANAHANLGFGGDFSAGDARFAANATGTAQDGSDRVVYNTSNGQLWYDADGNGAGVAQLLATLTAAPTLAATDFVVDNGSVPGGSVINGTAGNDTLSGTAGNDTVSGLGGNDTYLAGGTYGADVFDGGAGFDSIEFKAGATNAIMVDYNVGFISGGGTGSISFTSVERVVGGNFADTLNGDAVAQNLTGQGGNDTLAGGAGVDTLWGGFGSDAFVFREAGSANADRLNDFATGEDRIHLDDAFFTNIGAPGQFADGDQRFWVGAGVNSGHDADDRLVFNTSTGQLYYDADGSGAGAAQLVATILNGVMPWATDFVVI